MNITRAEINAFAKAVNASLLEGDEAIIIRVGVLPPSVDLDLASCTATVEGKVGKATESYTGHAVALNDAIWIARGKLREARAKHKRGQDAPERTTP